MAIGPLERTVILLAARPCERAMPGRKPARCWRWLFGHPAPKPLASPRLEALRQLAACVHASPSRQVPDHVVDLCRDSGWSHAELDQVVGIIRDPISLEVEHGPRPAVAASAGPARSRSPRARPLARKDFRAMSPLPPRVAEQAV